MIIKPKAIIYVRVSTDMQTESLKTQIDRCNAKCLAEDYEVYKIISDTDSGGNSQRVGFLELLQEINKKTFNVLVTVELSRVSRSLKTVLDFFEKLEEQQIQFIALNQKIETNNPMSRAIMKMISVFNEMERENTSIRTSQNMREQARQGKYLGGILAYGYILMDSKVVADPIKSLHIKELFSLFLEGVSKAELARKYEISNASIDYILSNPFYTGMVTFGKTKKNVVTGKKQLSQDYVFTPGNHEALIDEETFNLVQERIKMTSKKKPKHPSRYLLNGLLKCYCGTKLKATTTKGKHGYYFCANAKECRKKPVIQNEFELEILRQILELKNTSSLDFLTNEKLPDTSKDFASSLKALESELKKQESNKSKLLDLLLNGTVSETSFKTKEQEINISIKLIQEEISKLKEKSEIREIALNNKEQFFKVIQNMDENMNREEMKKLFSVLISEVKFINNFEYEVSWNI